MLRPYEALFIVRAQLEDEQVDSVVKKVEEFVTQNGGEIVRSEKKGKKRLAYEVKDQRDGHYALLNFTLDPARITELERLFRLTDEILRHLVLRQEDAAPVLPKPIPAPAPAPVPPVEVPA